jgi:hypothetical protein
MLPQQAREVAAECLSPGTLTEAWTTGFFAAREPIEDDTLVLWVPHPLSTEMREGAGQQLREVATDGVVVLSSGNHKSVARGDGPLLDARLWDPFAPVLTTCATLAAVPEIPFSNIKPDQEIHLAELRTTRMLSHGKQIIALARSKRAPAVCASVLAEAGAAADTMCSEIFGTAGCSDAPLYLSLFGSAPDLERFMNVRASEERDAYRDALEDGLNPTVKLPIGPTVKAVDAPPMPVFGPARGVTEYRARRDAFRFCKEWDDHECLAAAGIL